MRPDKACSNPILRRTLAVLFWLLVWHLLALRTDNSILLVSPWRAVAALGGLAVTADFWLTVAGSLVRIAAGFLLGMAAACVLAVLAAGVSLAEEVLHPIITLLKSVPVASFVVILLIWWGSSCLSAAVCFLIVLPVMYLNVLEGLKNADGKLLEMAEVFGMSRRNRFFYIYRPAVRPFAESGLKLALGMCWKSGVAAEVIGTPAYSIGERLYLSKIYLDTAGVFAWTAVVILLSVLFEKLFLRLAECFFAWEPACGRGTRRDDRKGPRRLLCRGISKSYGGQRVLCNYDAVYEPGETYYLTSPSGSGKTTLLRLLAGLEQADEGEILPRLHYSFLFQEDRLCEEYDAVKNVAMAIGDERAAGEALRRVLEEDALTKPCGRLSGGMKRRVALVRAMEAESECVLLDEPFAGLDREARERVERYIEERQRGRILLIATHI